MKFGSLAKTYDRELIISRRHEEWMVGQDNPHYSDEAIAFAQRQFIAERTPRDRTGSVSASSLGKCLRRQQFVFLGFPQKDTSTKTNAIFQNGTFMHIRWQMAGITAGWLKAAEVPVQENEFRLAGTMDGVCYEDSIVDFKSAASHNFNRAMTFGPLFGHEEQIATYVLAQGAEKGILLYENKDTQEYTEIVLPREKLPLETIQIRANLLWESMESKTLVEPLEQAYEKKTPCSTCPFVDFCLSVQSWSQAEEMAAA
jgi:hypothetical protein